MFSRFVLRSSSSISYRPAAILQRTFASHAHGHHAAKPQETLLQALEKRFPSSEGGGSSKGLSSRLDQLKKNHMKILSLDINWNVLQPEEKEESLRDLEVLVKRGYNTFSPEQKKAVAMANVYNIEPADVKAWDDLLSKNDELQLGDWKKMSTDEKKAAYYLAYGPVPESDWAFQKSVAFRVALFIGATYVFYSLVWNYFRSKKDLPTLTPEFQEALKERMIKERMDPFTGVSAHLFKEDK